MKKTRFTAARIMGILRQIKSGVPLSELCRKHGMSSASVYNCKYGGMDASLISEMKATAEENRRPKRMYAAVSMQTFGFGWEHQTSGEIPVYRQDETAVRSMKLAIAFGRFLTQTVKMR